MFNILLSDGLILYCIGYLTIKLRNISTQTGICVPRGGPHIIHGSHQVDIIMIGKSRVGATTHTKSFNISSTPKP